jgi:predicted membrane protein
MNPKTKKVLSIATLTGVIVFALFIFFKFYFVFGEGVKAGELNYFVHKGYVFKTYEGKMIQSGFRSQAAGTIQSYEFPFSVEDKTVADSLMRCSGKEVELHYKEYLGVLPWRGVNKFVVDKIVSVK